MKKLTLAILVTAFIGGIFTNCKKAANCETVVSKVSSAAIAYTSDPSVTNCNNYKAALQELIRSSCFSSLSSEAKAGYQEQVENLNCTPI